MRQSRGFYAKEGRDGERKRLPARNARMDPKRVRGAVRQANFTDKGKARDYADKRAALGYKVKAIIVTADGYVVLWSKS